MANPSRASRAWLLSLGLAQACAPSPTVAADVTSTDAVLDAAPDASPADAALADVALVDAAREASLVNPGRDILRTSLRFDLTAHTGVARLELAAGDAGASFEAQGLTISAVTDGRSDAGVEYRVESGQLHVAVPPEASIVVVEYRYADRTGSAFDGATPSYTFLWPYYCGNLFPCHSDPADGLRFDLALTGVPAGSTAVYPASLDFDAPSYQLAWAVGAYTVLDLGTTPAGTHLTARYLAGHASQATSATANLRDAFAWLESTLGPYPYGAEAGSVEVAWGPGAYGGMEHHPLWHVGSASLGDELTHFHEAAHGWFGDGIRLACWEDFVLSEGTVSYLAARATGAVHGDAAETAVWARYDASASGYGTLAWPPTCHQVDILADHLFSNTPYMRGANFYRALERRVGRAALDGVLRRFVLERRGRATSFTELLTLTRTVTGYDPASCAEAWLRPTATGMRGPATCP